MNKYILKDEDGRVLGEFETKTRGVGLTEKQKKYARQLDSNNVSRTEIAKFFGISTTTLRKEIGSVLRD